MPVFTSISQSAIAADPTLITNALLPATPGLTFDTASLVVVSAEKSIDLYDGSLGALGIGAGLLLTSGTMPGTSNTAGYFGLSNAMPGDPMLDAVINTVFPTVSLDATTITVNFTITDPTLTGISFNVVFGSDEYPEWVDQFVDIGAIWVNGVDVAFFNNDPHAPLSVIGSNLASNYFINNTANLTTPSFGGVARPGVVSTLPIEYDGVSAPLTIYAPVHQGLNTLKIGIADTRDHIYDSGLFISGMKGTTLPITGITLDVDGTGGNDELQGTDTPETIRGLDGDDDIHAAGGDDAIQAGAGDDFITGGAGNDQIDGGTGIDTANYLGASADYAVTANADGTYTVADQRAGAPDGTDTLINVDKIQFSDVTLDLATMQAVDRVTASVGTVPVKAPAAPPPVAVLPTTLSPQTATATEDGQSVSVDAFANIGTEDNGLSVTGLPGVLPPGVTYNAAVHAFVLDPSDAAFQALATGEQASVTLDYTLSNGVDSLAASVVFTITGTDDAPVVSGAVTAATTASGAAVSVNALALASDVDHGAVLSVVPAASSPPVVVPAAGADPHGKSADAPAAPAPIVVTDPAALPAGVTFDAATNSFTLDATNAAYTSLSAGQTAEIVVNYGVSDGELVTAASAVFTVTGVNDAPVVSGPVVVTAHEDGGHALFDHAALLANASDPDAGDTLSIQVDDASLPAGVVYNHLEGSTTTVVTTSYYGFSGTVTIPAVDTLTIDTSDAAYQSLAEGEELDIVVDYAVSDGTVSAPTQAIFQIIGANDAPIIAGSVTGSAIEGGAIAAIDALANASDVDHGAVLSVVAAPPPAPEFENFVNAAGVVEGAAPPPPPVLPFDPATLPAGVSFDAATQRFLIDPTDPAYRALSVGQTTTVTIHYGVSDGFVATAATASFTVTGTNQAPVVSGSLHATVYEDGARAGFKTTTAATSTGAVADDSAAASIATTDMLARASDIDAGDVLSVTGVSATLPTGVFTTQVPGGYYQPDVLVYGIDTSASAFQSLAAGEEMDVTLDYGVTDGIATTQTSAIFTIIGTNDAPVIATSAHATATEDAAPVVLDALATATDIDHGAVLSVVGVPATLPPGVTYDAATHSFSIDPANAAYQSLSSGQTQSVSIAYGVSDGMITTPTTAVFTVIGTNDGPIVGAPQSFAMQADAPAFTLNPLANVTDIDSKDVLRLVPGSLADGVHTVFIPGGYYQPDIAITQFNPGDAAFRSLAQGETSTTIWNYDVTDGTAIVHDSIAFTVTGVNDAPVITAPLSVAAIEDAAVITVDALANAIDYDHGAVLSVVNIPATLPAGITYNAATHSFSINPGDAAFQPLAAGEVQHIVVSYGVSDGMATTAATIQFDVTGTNDAPIVSGPMIATPNEGAGIVTVNATGNASDVDAHQGLQVTGMPTSLPAGVTYNAATQRLSLDSNNAAYDSLSLGETRDVVVNYKVFDGYVEVAASTIFSIQGRNDAPVVTGVVNGGIVTETAAPISLNLTSAAYDVDHLDTLNVVNTKGSGVTATVTSGNWTSPIAFTVTGNQLSLDPTQFKSLGATETVDVSFAYTITDGNPGGTVAASAKLTIAGQNSAPTGITLSASHVAENTASGTVVAKLASVDADRSDSFTYQLLGDTRGYFAISGGNLVVAAGAAIDYETATSDNIVLKTTDASGTSATSSFTIGIDNVVGVNINGSGNNDTYTLTSAVATTNEEDIVNGNNGDDNIDGAGGNDTLNGGSGNDTIFGGAGDDVITGGVGADIVNGGDGNDRIIVSGTEGVGDTMNGGAGIDTLVFSGSSQITLVGFNATASSIEVLEVNSKGLSGTSAAETFDLSGITLVSGTGSLILDAGDGNDTIYGTLFADDLRGAAGVDLIHGGAGNDILNGGAGADTLWGDAGNDTMTGGADADIFAFSGGFGQDTITDFVAGTGNGHDMLDFATAIFANFAAMKAASKQVGADTVITAGTDTLTLKSVSLTNVVAGDFTFH